MQWSWIQSYFLNDLIFALKFAFSRGITTLGILSHFTINKLHGRGVKEDFSKGQRFPMVYTGQWENCWVFDPHRGVLDFEESWGRGCSGDDIENRNNGAEGVNHADVPRIHSLVEDDLPGKPKFFFLVFGTKSHHKFSSIYGSLLSLKPCMLRFESGNGLWCGHPHM